MATNKVKPTKKQQKTFEAKLTNPEMPLGQAMIEGGYSEKSALNPGSNFVDSRGFEVLKDEYKAHLTDLGLNTKKIAEKMVEWIDAQKIHSSHTEPDRLVPDYQTQLKAGEMLKEDLGLKQEKGTLQVLNQGEMTVEFTK
jgi:hypothetical protein